MQKYSLQVMTNADDSKSISSLVWWRVPTTATVRALYSLAYSVAQPVEMSGMVHPDDVTCKLSYNLYRQDGHAIYYVMC